jgi:hypothetical protein
MTMIAVTILWNMKYSVRVARDDANSAHSRASGNPDPSIAERSNKGLGPGSR